MSKADISIVPTAIPNKIKMVIWDLDDTFWQNTLAERGEIVPSETNIEIVKVMTDRGIVSSICSRNNFDDAKAELIKQGIWDYFVFPKIAFAPKGEAIASIIDEANLRPDNVLFIDDNRMNLEEAAHFSPNLMVALPEDILPLLLDTPQAAGKTDSSHEKLQQYKNLEKKQTDRSVSIVSNEEFLRGCGIKVHIDYDIDKYRERVIDLANKTNQLNFTKVRIETSKQEEEYDILLATYGVHGGVVKVVDRYGDYGVVGYFVITRLPGKHILHHFVFSCRTMNMGVEQYVYEKLGKPKLTIVPPVSNPVSPFLAIDWIAEHDSAEGNVLRSAGKLVLLGACQLLQLATMCSDTRTEFVNEARNGWWIMPDDAGFILGDIAALAQDGALKHVNFWSAGDKAKLDSALVGAEILLIASLGMGAWNYFMTKSGNMCRLFPYDLNRMVKNEPMFFFGNFTFVRRTETERIELIIDCLDSITSKTNPETIVYMLGSVTGRTMPLADKSGYGPVAKKGRHAAPPMMVNWRSRVNTRLREYCSADKRLRYLDVESIVPPEEQYDEDHFTRRGYALIGDAINSDLG